MPPGDTESHLSEAHSDLSIQHSISKESHVADRTRFVATRRGLVQQKITATISRPNLSIVQALPNQSTLANIPRQINEETEIIDDEEQMTDEDPSSSELGQIPLPSSNSISSRSQSDQRSIGLVKKKRSRTSPIHDHCKTIRRQDGDYWVCDYCNKDYKLTGGTGAFKGHLEKRHHINLEASLKAIKRDLGGTAIDLVLARSSEVNMKKEAHRRQELLALGIDKTALEYLYIRYMVKRDLPFEHVANEDFRDLLEYVNPAANQLLPKSGTTIKNHAQKLFLEGKKRLRYLIATAISDIHITCDMWTSPNHLGLLAVVGHFTTEESELTACLLGLAEVPGQHTGAYQADIVLRILKEFGIMGKVGFFVMDNASSNDCLIQGVANALLEEGIHYDIAHRRLRCNGHVINLAARAFLFDEAVDDYDYLGDTYEKPSKEELTKWRRLGPLGKLHNIVVWIFGSPQRIQAFTKHGGGLMPHRDNGTRWNSWYDMLNWTLSKIKSAIIAISNEVPALDADRLTAGEWTTLTRIRDFIEPFLICTKACEGKHATLDRVLPTLDYLCYHFEKAIAQTRDDHYLNASLQAGQSKLLKFWNKTDRSPAYISAIVLNPTKKWGFFNHWLPTWQPQMKDSMRRFWEVQYRSCTGQSEFPTKYPIIEDTENDFEKWEAEIMANSQQTQVDTDEYDTYLNDPILPSSTQFVPMTWWRQPAQRERYPLLSKMAIDIFSIPAMSAEPERVFSGAKHTISAQRWRLQSETIELLECLKSWFSIRIFTEQDLHTIVATMENVGEEEYS